MIKKKERVFLNGQMAKNMMGCGRMESSMDKGCLLIVRGIKARDSGLMES
jgi:hypothetical protein